ncbi:hypothetical protein, partial [Nostoc sp.]|uniref:hypothetical protein n=1 Tax=Nostoc sp. TaxID=1180 RepID=UPI002FF8D30B
RQSPRRSFLATATANDGNRQDGGCLTALPPQCPMTAVAPLGETPRPFGFGSPPDARSSLPLPLTTETAKTGAASPHCLPNTH